jgi:hypothetical protein
MGRPKKSADLQLIKSLALIGATNKQIADRAGISHDTLQRHYLPLIHESRADGEMRILAKIFRKATEGSMRALELSAVNRLGWSTRPDSQTVVNVQTNYAGAQPSAAEFKARFAAAQTFLEEHRAELQNNGQRTRARISGV